MNAISNHESNLKASTRTSYLVMLCTLGSRGLGFVRLAVIAALFGASGVADVWNAVFTVPNNLRKLLAEGALSSAFIPTLSASLLARPGRGAGPADHPQRITGPAAHPGSR